VTLSAFGESTATDMMSESVEKRVRSLERKINQKQQSWKKFVSKSIRNPFPESEMKKKKR